MSVEIVVPDLGLDPARGLILSAWLVSIGDPVVEGDRVVELLADEITVDLGGPATGRLIKKFVDVDETVAIGAVLGVIKEEVETEDDL
jgi:pyruvate/2-oxoglutarate dehydrogenase complex dihydrolipoamide acyltransferase (E2) component